MKKIILSTIPILCLSTTNIVYSASNNSVLNSENCNNINESDIQSDCLKYAKNLVLIDVLQSKILSSLNDKEKNGFNTEVSLWKKDVSKFCSKPEYDTEMYYNRYSCLEYFSTEREKVLSYYYKSNYKTSDNITGTYTWKQDSKAENICNYLGIL